MEKFEIPLPARYLLHHVMLQQKKQPGFSARLRTQIFLNP
jgi:hypothetical protein